MSAQVEEIKKSIKVLKDARKLLSKPNGWSQGVIARTADGDEIPAHDFDQRLMRDKSRSFCPIGAVAKVTDVVSYVATTHPAFKYVRGVMGDNIIEANDAPDTYHIDVLMSFDLAILMAQDDLKEAKKRGK